MNARDTAIRMYQMAMLMVHNFRPHEDEPSTCVISGPLVNMPIRDLSGDYEASRDLAHALVWDMASVDMISEVAL